MADSSNGDINGWLQVAWDIAKYVLAAIGFVATSAWLWMTGKYGGHVAMLLRHEKHLEENDAELGLLKAQRIEMAKGPFGAELEQAIRSIDEQLDEQRGVDTDLQTMIRNEASARAVAEAEHNGKLLAIEVKIEERFKHISESLARIERK